MTGRPAVADYPPGAHLPPRVIDDFEFVWMLRGRAWFSAGEQVPLEPGLLLLVPPGLRHSFRWDPARPSRHGYVHFGPEGLQAPPRRMRLLRMTATDPLAALCGYLLWLGSGTPDGWQHRARQTLEFMLVLAGSGPLPDTEPPPPALEPALRLAVAHLRKQWSSLPLRRIEVRELAATALVSRGYLNRLFQAAFYLSVSAALEQVRCARAETLLARTDLPVETVARQCGFADLAHFSHRFSSIHGASPSVYRAAPDRAPSVLEHPGVRRLDRLLWE